MGQLLQSRACVQRERWTILQMERALILGKRISYDQMAEGGNVCEPFTPMLAPIRGSEAHGSVRHAGVIPIGPLAQDVC